MIENGFVLGGVKEYKINEVLNYGCNRHYKSLGTGASTCTKYGYTADWSIPPVCEREFKENNPLYWTQCQV